MELYIINEREFVNKILWNNDYCAIYSIKKVLVVQLSHGRQEYSFFSDPMTILAATGGGSY